MTKHLAKVGKKNYILTGKKPPAEPGTRQKSHPLIFGIDFENSLLLKEKLLFLNGWMDGVFYAVHGGLQLLAEQ